MKRTPFFIFQVVLFLSDLAAVMLSFGFAYYVRLHVDTRPFFFDGNTKGFLLALLAIIPLWAIILLVSGIYERKNVSARSALYPRLAVVAVLSVLGLVAFDFFTKSSILETRSIALYAMLICFAALVFLREVATAIYRLLLRHGRACQRVVVYGDHENTRIFAAYVRDNPSLGYRIVGVVAKKAYLPGWVKQYKSLTTALEEADVDLVVQTETSNAADVYARAISRHVGYMYVPDNETIAQNAGELMLLGTQPVVDIRATPLINEGRLLKRAFDLVLGLPLFVLALPFGLILALVQKITLPSAPIFYKSKRVTRFGRVINVYKFRSMNPDYNGLSPEEAFKKAGREDLLEQYRAGRDDYDDSFRLTKFGRFLRATSLDEIPQFWNVLKGDISLVGPRALIPSEIKAYPKHSVILLVKSGLTGLAQVSGRKSISFEERRTLDIYYVQHWSIWLDLQILARTVKMVILMRGAK